MESSLHNIIKHIFRVDAVEKFKHRYKTAKNVHRQWEHYLVSPFIFILTIWFDFYNQFRPMLWILKTIHALVRSYSTGCSHHLLQLHWWLTIQMWCTPALVDKGNEWLVEELNMPRTLSPLMTLPGMLSILRKVLFSAMIKVLVDIHAGYYLYTHCDCVYRHGRACCATARCHWVCEWGYYRGS